MAKIDWLAIRNEYINTNISYRKLAEKYSISFPTLRDRARKEKWTEQRKCQRDRIIAKTSQKTAEKIADQEASRIARLLSLADRLADKIEQAIEEADKYTTEDKTRMTSVTYNALNQPIVTMSAETTKLKILAGAIDKGGLKKISAALKDVRDIQATDTSADTLQKLDDVLAKIGGNL